MVKEDILFYPFNQKENKMKQFKFEEFVLNVSQLISCILAWIWFDWKIALIATILFINVRFTFKSND